MWYIVSETSEPLTYISSGEVYRKSGFLHPYRVLDYNVFIFVNEGSLFMTQNGKKYAIKEKHFITLPKNTTHGGWKVSEEPLSYYWIHFRLPEATRVYRNFSEIQEVMERYKNRQEEKNNLFLLPETGKVADAGEKFSLLFGQTLDFGSDNSGNADALQKYSMSTMFLELTREFAQSLNVTLSYKPMILKINDWIRGNYINRLTVAKIADQFKYNPDYLSSEYKKQTGISLRKFINKTRIEIAKKLLATQNKSIKEIAYSSGFNDEKHFMKVFKTYEKVTPSEYRQAFCRKIINPGKTVTSYD